MKPIASFVLALLSLTVPLFAAPVSLFDGKTLDGWDYDPAVWRIEDGVITGGSTTEKIKANYFICTKKSYANFELRMKIKCSGDPKTGMINSGIQIRSLRVPGGHHMSGYQIDCGAGWFGKIYDEFRRNRVIATPVDQAALDKVVDVFGWNEYRIRAEGPRIQTWINGVLAIDYTEADKNIALDGQIGPQVHSGGACLVQVKDVTIEELPPTPGAPTWESLGGLDAARKLVAPPPKKPAAAAPKPMKEGNAVQGTAKSAAEQQKLFKLPEGYEIELVVQESEGLGKFISVYFDQRGRMWTQTAFEYPVDGNENPAAAEALYKTPGKDKVVVFPREALNAPLPAGGLTNPTIFTDGLAIPLGILPWGNGDTCYIQHGPDLKLFKDTDGDGRADTHDVILTGFGVQDSHLFPHQFTRAPGGWIWMAQGLFNNSKVRQPDGEAGVDWPKCSMAKMRPDGSGFEVTSTGPNNIWGLVITGEGEAFIQEANDYGYPVMPFHEYAYYPGGMEALKRSYQPDFPPQAEFRMGGTGLSGLALLEGEMASRVLAASAQSSVPSALSSPTSASPLTTENRELRTPAYTMAVANPIISKVQTIAMHRDGPYWKLEQAADLVTCDDPFFRPVAMTNGPDGCFYIVDWYNKIISHNEVPRTHPDRDKTRGRIWRVKAKGTAPIAIPDFTNATGDELIAMLGLEPLGRSHLAWQTLVDRFANINPPIGEEVVKKTLALALDDAQSIARRVQATWVLRESITGKGRIDSFTRLARSTDRNIRREFAGMDNWLFKLPHEAGQPLAPLKDDRDSEVRAAVIRRLGARFLAVADRLSDPKWNLHEVERKGYGKALAEECSLLLAFAQPPLFEPTTPSSRNGKPILVREAYDRAFERFLVRMLLERHPEAVAKFLDSDSAKPLPVEATLLASLALEPKASATRVAKLLPQLERAPGQEEVLRLAQFPDEPGVGEALRAALNNPATRTGVLESLLATRTKLDAAKLRPILTDAAKQLLSAKDEASVQLGLQLAGSFQLRAVEPELVALASRTTGGSPVTPLPNTGGPPVVPLAALRALRDLGSTHSELFSRLATTSKDPQLRTEALLALAASRAPDAGERLFKLWPSVAPAQRRTTLERLASTQPGAKSIVAAIGAGTLKKDELDGPTVEKLQAVLGDDPALTAVLGDLASLFRPVLALDGTEDAWTQTALSFDGPLTVETWVRLAPGLSNADGILGVPGKLDVNFHAGKLRVYAGSEIRDAVVATKAMTPELWTHVAAVRDAEGRWALYLDGQRDPAQSKPAPGRLENVRIAWTGAKGGTHGALAEFRLWNRARTAEEIARDFDRGLAQAPGLVFTHATAAWGKLSKGARVTKTSDFPPILTAEEAIALDAKFSKYRALALQPGDATRGKTTAMLCSACHLFKGQGGNIGPDLSGVGAMGVEAILRNLLTPNAAMEAGYRIFRVELKGGDIVDAFFVSEDKDAIVIRQAGTSDRRIPRAEISRTQYLRRSLMPEGLLDVLPPAQVSDLFAYLLSLK